MFKGQDLSTGLQQYKTLERRWHLQLNICGQRAEQDARRGNAILDQILTNMSHLFEPAQHLPPLGHSDHQCLLFKPKQWMKLSLITKKFLPMKPGNLQTLQAEMSKETWESVINAEDVDNEVFILISL
ncbi:Hypothetical predicted protein [Paramuricea clavata]|uniref:Uncharacterized protein n=1 Tax=Paramuricea clavata TaxID=317549 RepID=A0A6S7I747_PARCT|nr:Hypothetical predicted protein [Paramuricea clavata]